MRIHCFASAGISALAISANLYYNDKESESKEIGYEEQKARLDRADRSAGVCTDTRGDDRHPAVCKVSAEGVTAPVTFVQQSRQKPEKSRL